MTIVFGHGPFGHGAFGGSLGAGVSAPGTFSATSGLGYAATLALDASGDLEIPLRVAKGDEAIRLNVQQRLRFFQGEWYRDLREGVPYIQRIFVKGTPIGTIRSIFRRVILSCPQVVSLSSLDIVPDYAERRGTVTFQGRIDDGRTITATDEPFIIPREAA